MSVDRRRGLPSVEALVEAVVEKIGFAAGTNGAAPPDRSVVTRLARARLAALREQSAVEGESALPDLDSLLSALESDARALTVGALVPVINATGVILQTNLGRAPLSEAAQARLHGLVGGYTNLEYDLEAGKRGERSRSLAATFEALLGVPAVVVNNNAASLLLALASLARGREVIVSRGELIEIGGSFRLPDVMRSSGARLVEVGTTNRTRIADYGEAITPRTAMILKVHTSNFRVVGFVESAPIKDLAELAREHEVVLMEDLGSGSLLPTEKAGLAHEPTVQEALAAGADLVAFSGDKLLGGPQSGIVAGREDLVRKLGKHPLYRALRPDKLTLAALEATLSSYLRGTGDLDLPLWRMILESAESTRARATAWADAAVSELGDAVAIEVVEVESTVGGGSLPGEVLRGFGLAVGAPGRRPSAGTLGERLRRGAPAVLGRVQDGRLILDPRTVLSPVEDAAVVDALVSALQG